ncbi:DUF1444 family protein [Faecalicatena contorta]|uniref:DUF1444 family protein n=1 Tax=Faecalicatena contorta TaxID=39482 RepID=UPI001F311281|nr:DUF1444 family protein [Faecalicatena contorta]MCF2554084.1 DUF1444 family protein [Faecalicatena contorta]MCF2679687.1 DUF1444 family protein [Faecalicatena contorta]
MKKYEEEHYRYDSIKENIYPWVKNDLIDSHALNGKSFSEKDTPVIAFIGDLKIIFAIKRDGDSYEILKDNMLPPDINIEELYHTACENLVRDVEFVIGNTWYGAFGILADGVHEASAVCFKHIWQVCVDKLKDDLVIMVPAKDTVLFAPAGQKEVVDKMIEHGQGAYDTGTDRISMQLFYFSQAKKELSIYEA